MLENEKYRKERVVRRKYRRRGVRRSILQRGYYESTRVDGSTERREGSWSLGRGKSIWLVRSNQRRRRRRVWRRRIPGRLKHEWNKVKRRTRVSSRILSGRSWRWYNSEIELGRKDRRRSIGYVRVPIRRRKSRGESEKIGRRKRRRWSRRRIRRWVGRSEESVRKDKERKEIGRSNGEKENEHIVLTDFSIRKILEWINIVRRGRRTRLWTERRRRANYRYKGRKGGKRK